MIGPRGVARAAAGLQRRAAPACLLALGLLACGKKGPNQPPVRILPSPAREIAVRQIGGDIVLSARLPMQETDGRPLGPKAQVRILKLRATETLKPGAVSPGYLTHQFEKTAQTIASLSGAALEAVAADGRLRFLDADVLGKPPAGVRARYMYSVLIVDEQGKRSPLPAPLLIEAVPPVVPPHDLKVETAEGEIRLTWKAGEPEAAPHGAAPGGARGPALFNLYRRAQADARMPDAPQNRRPIEGTSYVDTEFAYAETYHYLVRAVGRSGIPLLESADSPEVEVHAVDIYPPKAPSGVAAAAEGGAIRVYWFPNAEPDLAGYRIYRRDAPGGEYARIGQAGPSETSYTDTDARAGVRYYYVVTAIDSATPPNESVRSDEKSDVLPAEAAPSLTPGAAARPKPSPGGPR